MLKPSIFKHLKRSRRGLGLVDAGLGSMIFIGFMAVKIDQTRQEQTRLNIQSEARILTKLSDATFELVFGQPENYAVGTATEIKMTDLTESGILGTETSLFSSFGAKFSTHVFRKTPQEFVIFSRSSNTLPSANLNRWVVSGTGIKMVGLVHQSNSTVINGPSLNYNLGWMDNKFSAFKPQVGDMVAVSILRKNMHLDEYLHRIETPLTPSLNSMATDLTLGMNNIINVGDIAANTINISDTLKSQNLNGSTQFLGNVNMNSIAVSGNAAIKGETIISGDLTAANVKINNKLDVNRIQSDVLTIKNNLIVNDVTVTNKLSADLIAVKNGNIETLNSNKITSDNLLTGTISSDKINSTTGIFEEISVTDGGCTGC